jgi:hypothetical protein
LEENPVTAVVDSSIVTDDGAILTVDGNGYILCNSDQTYWCSHIEQAVRNAQDTPYLASLLEVERGHTPPLEHMMAVPMFPTHNLWDDVVLEPRPLGNSGAWAWAVMQYTPQGDREFRGFISEGEGRLVVRSMLFDHFAQQDMSTLECNSGTHGLVQERAWQNAMKDAGARTASLYCVSRTQKCLACRAALADPAAPDLIPDDRGAPKSPWNR